MFEELQYFMMHEFDKIDLGQMDYFLDLKVL